ncbi:MAG: hypothetical protein IPK78_16960 [Rhodospirillales bacterium]|nr:hypothetical protein [Rhodospirillales bacterium]
MRQLQRCARSSRRVSTRYPNRYACIPDALTYAMLSARRYASGTAVVFAT